MQESRGVKHPNRELPESVRTKQIVVALLAASVLLVATITAGGWSVLEGAQSVQIFYVLIYAAAAFLVARWNRGMLPLVSALALVLIIVAAVAAPEWFSRGNSGFEEPLIPAEILGLLTLLVVPLQIVLIIYAMLGFRQNWNVEA